MGFSSFPRPFVSSRKSEPSGFIVAILNSPRTCETNTIRSPRGDQFGEALYEPSNVILRASVPSEPITYSCGVPTWPELKTISLPFGAQDGDTLSFVPYVSRSD